MNFGIYSEILFCGNHNLLKEKTAESFTKDGWWKTGDLAIIENGVTRSVKVIPLVRTSGPVSGLRSEPMPAPSGPAKIKS